MSRAVIVGAVRSPLGKRAGALASLHPADLSAQVLNGLVAGSGIDPGMVDDVIWGCVSQAGEQTNDIARTAALAAGWPLEVTGVTIDRQCGSSQQAVHFAAASLVAGHADVVIAGGVESMSRVPIGSPAGESDPWGPAFLRRFDGVAPFQGDGAELVAERWGLSRTRMDEYALRSHELAAAAQDRGDFDVEIVPIRLADGTLVTRDEGVRRSGSLDALAQLRPAFRPGGRITAGNSSQISDGAAALLMTTEEKAAELGLTPLAAVHTAVVAGADPVLMLTAPIPATLKALKRAGLDMTDIGTFEFNEAFAAPVLAWLDDIGADSSLVNPSGGAIALGHPLGASGARVMVTLVHRMRATSTRYGLQTMCEGGGQSNATVLELL